MENKFPAFCIIDDKSKKFSLMHPDAELPFISNDCVFQELKILKFKDSHIKIPRPNIVKVLISNAKKYDEESENLGSEIIKDNVIREADEREAVIIKNAELIYKFIAVKSSAAINAYQAIEAFCNLCIPEDYKYCKKTKKSTEYFNKEQIERHFSTSEKLKRIVPDIFSIESIEKNSIWTIFLTLEKIRHELIHQKASKHDKLINVLLDSYQIEFSEIAKETVAYFVNEIFNKSLNDLERFDYNVLSRLPQFQETKILLEKGIGWDKWDGVIEP